MSLLRKIRRTNYQIARQLGDVDAILHPSKAPKRIANKILGRKVISKIWR